MSYKAIITKIKIRPHPKADRLNLAEVAGHQLICGKEDYQDNDVVIFFPEGGQLSEDLCYNNNLYRENKGENKDPGVFGFFESNRRVRCIKLRGAKSEGFVLPLSALEYTSVDIDTLRPGQLIDSIGPHLLCNKYETRATKKAKAKAGGTARKDINKFAKVGDTGKFRYQMNSIPKGAVLTLSEKIHGTSGRTGFISIKDKVALPNSWYNRLWRWIKREAPFTFESAYKLISGSRRMIVAIDEQTRIMKPDGTHVPLGYRQVIHNSFDGCLYPGESVYYEIVVCNSEGIPDFRHSINDSKLSKKYGSHMYYRYNVAPGSHAIWIYRITRQNEEGDSIQLSWNQMVRRAGQLGVQTVPQLGSQFIYDGDPEALKNFLATMADGSSVIDSTHIREGLCIHIDSPNMACVLKYKGWHFCSLENIVKNDDNYVDPEEIA